mmetsp:Transcript_97937/g.277275  ORF Transcript_97937/g.277275 Transcript_97937/m.277275 type:complete len:200 (+) Transcript_97937:970-1569(+)
MCASCRCRRVAARTSPCAAPAGPRAGRPSTRLSPRPCRVAPRHSWGRSSRSASRALRPWASPASPCSPGGRRRGPPTCRTSGPGPRPAPAPRAWAWGATLGGSRATSGKAPRPTSTSRPWTRSSSAGSRASPSTPTTRTLSPSSCRLRRGGTTPTSEAATGTTRTSMCSTRAPQCAFTRLTSLDRRWCTATTRRTPTWA